jgi:short-subunit dehydrogenase
VAEALAVGRRRAAERAAAGLGTLVNCAGFGSFAPFAELDPATARALVELHVQVPIALTRAAMPAMVANGAGAIVNVASGLAFAGTLARDARPRRPSIVYMAAKAFVVTFTRALAEELKGTGLRVQALCPSATRTELQGDSPPATAMRADDVVAASVSALQHGEVLCLPGLEDPTLVDRLGTLELTLLNGNAGPEPAARYRVAAQR